MKFDVFAYDFPHWKTHKGIGIINYLNLVPETVLLAPKKVLNHPQSKRKLTPENEYFPDPKRILNALDYNYIVQPHEAERLTTADYAIILGARILPKYVIDRYPKGIINIHPGILPGNRGLDNLKWAIFNKWPIGATAHYIDHRIDMGRAITYQFAEIPTNCNLQDVYAYLRQAEVRCLKKGVNDAAKY